MATRTRTILHTSTEVTRHTPAAGFNTRLLTITTPSGTRYIYPNPLGIILKLFTAAGVQIPPTSHLFVFKRRPGEDFPMNFLRRIPYAAYHDLTEGQQRDERFRHATLHDLGSEIAEISNPEDHELQIWVESPVVVDLARAETRFETIAYEINL